MKPYFATALLLAVPITGLADVIYSSMGYTTEPRIDAIIFTTKPGRYPGYTMDLKPTRTIHVEQTQNQFTGTVIIDPQTGFVRGFVAGERIDSLCISKHVAPFGGAWVIGQERYVGFKIDDLSNNERHYSWLRLRWNANDTFTFVNAGYEAEPFTPITAGDMLSGRALSVVPMDKPGEISVAWNDSAIGWTLQHSADLKSWQNHSAPIVGAGNKSWSLEAFPHCFFRLVKP